MAGDRDVLRRLERFARRRVRDPMRDFFRRDRRRTGQSPGLTPALPQAAPVRTAGAEIAELTRHILGQQTMLTHLGLDRLDRSLLLQGRIAANQGATLARIRHLGEVEFRVCSQWGEDGIIDWLCDKLPDIPRTFVEFGVESFAEANTRFLIENRGWRGLVH